MATPVRDVFGLTVLKNSHPDVRRIKRAVGNATIHGNKFWRSTYLMIDYLRANPPKRRWRILEVGCGWGISGIYCAQAFAAKVTAMDVDKTVFAYLQHHAQLNGVHITTLTQRFEAMTIEKLSCYDMIIGSDICFWDDMSRVLYNLINRGLRAGVQRVVITDPGREPFRQLAERCCDKQYAAYNNWVVPHPVNTSGLVLDIS